MNKWKSPMFEKLMMNMFRYVFEWSDLKVVYITEHLMSRWKKNKFRSGVAGGAAVEVGISWGQTDEACPLAAGLVGSELSTHYISHGWWVFSQGGTASRRKVLYHYHVISFSGCLYKTYTPAWLLSPPHEAQFYLSCDVIVILNHATSAAWWAW
jgi:hypothetical protein